MSEKEALQGRSMTFLNCKDPNAKPPAFLRDSHAEYPSADNHIHHRQDRYILGFLATCLCPDSLASFQNCKTLGQQPHLHDIPGMALSRDTSQTEATKRKEQKTLCQQGIENFSLHLLTLGLRCSGAMTVLK